MANANVRSMFFSGWTLMLKVQNIALTILCKDIFNHLCYQICCTSWCFFLKTMHTAMLKLLDHNAA